MKYLSNLSLYLFIDEAVSSVHEILSSNLSSIDCPSDSSLTCIHSCHNDSQSKTYAFTLQRASFVSGVTLILESAVNINDSMIYNETNIDIVTKGYMGDTFSTNTVNLLSKKDVSRNSMRLSFTKLLIAIELEFNLTFRTNVCFTVEVHASPLKGKISFYVTFR